MRKSITYTISCVSLFALFVSLFPILDVFAQSQYMPVRHQWMMTNDPNQLVCQPGMGLMLGNNGNPACVSPSTYMRLVDRGWGNYDINQMTRDQHFMTGVMNNMMYHPQLMGQMMNNPQMIQAMHANDQWMGMMHSQAMMMGQGMGMNQGMMMNYTMGCPMCGNMIGQHMMMNQAWMMHNPQSMYVMMGTMMNDAQFQQQMMNHMLGNQQYMQQLMQNQTFMKKMIP